MIPVMDDDSLRRFLSDIRTIAVVGWSADPTRPSHRVSESLRFWGYRLLPVNPQAGDFFGEPCYPDLEALPEAPDLVLVFRRPEHAPGLVDQTVRLGSRAIWFQPGTGTAEAQAKALNAGLLAISGPCIAREYIRLVIDSSPS